MADIKVEHLQRMGTDFTVVAAARVSFEKETSKDPAGLIRYLARNAHWTPFGHCFATFRIKAPIFVARQLYKHIIGLCVTDDDEARTIQRGLAALLEQIPEDGPVVNEVSRRYVDSEPEFFRPTSWRKQSPNVKQGSSEEIFDEQLSFWFNRWCQGTEDDASTTYTAALREGMCREQARMFLPLSTMTEWWWSGSLAAFARVCSLRLDPHAQEESRQVAKAISDYMRVTFPVSWKYLVPASNEEEGA